MSIGTMSGSKFEIYEDAAGEHRWRVTARNGEIIGASSEGYVNEADAERNAVVLGLTLVVLRVADGIF